MNTNNLLVKYNILADTARTPTENKNRIATMYGRELSRQKTAEEFEKGKDAKQAIRNQNTILNAGMKVVSGTRKYKVPVIGKFAYTAIVVAANEEDASRLASYQALHMCLAMNPKVTKTGKPKVI